MQGFELFFEIDLKAVIMKEPGGTSVELNGASKEQGKNHILSSSKSELWGEKVGTPRSARKKIFTGKRENHPKSELARGKRRKGLPRGLNEGVWGSSVT